MPITKIDFQDAISHLTNTGALFGALFVDANSQIVIDEGNNNADITPDEATLTQALIDFQAAQNLDVIQTARQDGAKSQFSNIPTYATMTEEAALLWHDTNIADTLPVANLTDANEVLTKLATENRALLQMVIALRNRLFPDLEGS